MPPKRCGRGLKTDGPLPVYVFCFRCLGCRNQAFALLEGSLIESSSMGTFLVAGEIFFQLVTRMLSLIEHEADYLVFVFASQRALLCRLPGFADISKSSEKRWTVFYSSLTITSPLGYKQQQMGVAFWGRILSPSITADRITL
jgi:hypothetical protein